MYNIQGRSSDINHNFGDCIHSEYLSNESTEACDEGRDEANDPENNRDASDATLGRVGVLDPEPNERNLFLR